MLRRTIPFNPRLAVDKFYPPPLHGIRNNSKTIIDIDAKLSVPYPASIWHLSQKKQKKKSVDTFFFFRKLRFSDVMSRHSRSKINECLNDHKTKSIDVNCTKNCQKIGNDILYKMAISDFQNYDFLTPKISKNTFSDFCSSQNHCFF